MSANRPALERLLPAVALCCAFLVVWIVQHPGVGFAHDSRYYLIQALARLDPALFSQDIYLRHGSQDQYTVFSPLFAWGMQLFGVENAASIFSFLAQAGFFAATFVLARMLMPVRWVWLSLLLLCALPGFYGPAAIFKIVEEYTTPRLFAETVVVAGLAAFLKRRFILAGAFALGGMLLHPLIAVGGIVVALCTNITPPRLRVLAIACGVVGASALFAWIGLHGHPLRFDEQWVRLLRGGLDYLWPSNWDDRTWPNLLVTLTTLVIGMIALERSPARTLCTASLIAGVAGVALNYVAGDLLEIVLAVQSQPYRWLWLSTLVATLVLPLIAQGLWTRGVFGRVAVLLLIAAWLSMRVSYGIAIALLALMASVASTRSTRELPLRTQRLILIGAAAVLVLAVIYHVALLSLYTDDSQDFRQGSELLRSVRTFSRTGALPIAVGLVLFVAIRKFSARASQLGIVAGCVVMLAVLLPEASREWTTRWYGRDYDAFAPWRALIPPGTEVFWFNAPVSTWMLLQRPSYISNMQDNSGLFSRPAAMVLKHRVDLLEPYLATEPLAAWRDKQLDRLETLGDRMAREHNAITLSAVCAAAPDLRFMVTRKNIIGAPLAQAPPKVSQRYSEYRLYRCDRPQ